LLWPQISSAEARGKQVKVSSLSHYAHVCFSRLLYASSTITQLDVRSFIRSFIRLCYFIMLCLAPKTEAKLFVIKKFICHFLRRLVFFVSFGKKHVFHTDMKTFSCCCCLRRYCGGDILCCGGGNKGQRSNLPLVSYRTPRNTII